MYACSYQSSALCAMTSFKRSSERLRGHQRYTQWAFVFALSVFVYAQTATVEASIVGPAAPEFSLEPSVDQSSSGHGAQSSRSSYGKSTDGHDHQIELGLFFAEQSPGGHTSSSSSPTSGGGASFSSAIAYLPASIISDPNVAGWVSGERQVSLPALVRNELLRPPQEGMCFLRVS